MFRTRKQRRTSWRLQSRDSQAGRTSRTSTSQEQKPTFPDTRLTARISLKDSIQTMERKDKIMELVKSLLPAHQRGKNLVIDTCPFCGEKNVMAFSPDKEVAKCFRCGESVTLLGLVMKVKNCARQEAEEYINKNL